MIINIIISGFLSAITALTSLLPSFSIPTVDSDAGLLAYVIVWNNVMPVKLICECIVATLGLNLAFIIFDGAVWLYHQIHGSE